MATEIGYALGEGRTAFVDSRRVLVNSVIPMSSKGRVGKEAYHKADMVLHAIKYMTPDEAIDFYEDSVW